MKFICNFLKKKFKKHKEKEYNYTDHLIGLSFLDE